MMPPRGQNALQKMLTNLGYNPGEIKVHFGEVTEAAVRKFQEDRNIPVDEKRSSLAIEFYFLIIRLAR